MRLSSPKQSTWWVAVILGALGIIGTFVSIPFVSTYAFWVLALGWLLLVLATFLKNL
jgi:hypothetical protein